MHTLNFCFCFCQDQDKLRPLSRLANLAISITDVQDMDPIFTNLPYSTNIEEDVPLVSNTIPPDITLPQLVSYSCSFYVKPCSLSISFCLILLCWQHFRLIFQYITHPQVFLSHAHTLLSLFRKCLEHVRKKMWLKTEAHVIISAGCLTSLSSLWVSPLRTLRTPILSPRPLHTALQV